MPPIGPGDRTGPCPLAPAVTPASLSAASGRRALPAGRTGLAGVAAAPRARGPNWAWTTTPPGPAATRFAWPGPWCSTTWPVPLPTRWRAPSSAARSSLADLAGPVIFAANHASHADTPLLLSCLPLRFRHRTVVAAAADYFFDRRWKAAAWSFLLAAIPIERNRVNRRSAELAADLVADGWNLVIFPEGGRSPDGWAQTFRGGAAYLALRTGAPVVPVHLEGTRRLLPKGGTVPAPGQDDDHLRDPAATALEERTPAASAARIEAAMATTGRRGRHRLVDRPPAGR